MQLKNQKKNKLRKNRDDDSSGEDVENIMLKPDGDGDDDDDYETLSDSDSDTESDSEYVPYKKKHSRKYVEEEEDDDDEEEDEDDESDIDPRELRKTLATLFPSNYINQKVKRDAKISKKS